MVLAVFAAQTDRYPFKDQFSLLHDGIAAHIVKIKLNTVINDAGQFSDDQVNLEHPFGISLFSVAFDDLDDVLGHGKFMHTVIIGSSGAICQISPGFAGIGAA